MSFSVDLWNGFDIIKNQFNSLQKKVKTFSKLLSSYITIENNYCKSLESLYKEYKENNTISELLLDQSFQKIIDTIEYETQNRKIYYNNLIKIVVEPINAYLEKPKFLLNKCFSDNIENTEIFNRLLNILIEKQGLFHNNCKELSSYLALMEIDEINKTNKTNKNKCQKLLDKVNYIKEDYINCIKETNKEREKYNNKTEEILYNLERMYKNLVETLQESLVNFAGYRLEFFRLLINKEQNEYENIHLKVIPDKEIFDFIMKNATKEFPMIKFEFCPIKYGVLNNFIKNKFKKIHEKELTKIYKAIKNYFESNNIFKDDLITKSNKKSGEFFNIRRFTFFSKKSLLNNENNENDNDILKVNKEFLEKYLTDLFMENEIIKENNDKNIENKNIENIENKKENIEYKKKEISENINHNNYIEKKESNGNEFNEKGEEKEKKEEIEKKGNENKDKNNNIISKKEEDNNNLIENQDNNINEDNGNQMLKKEENKEKDYIDDKEENIDEKNNKENLIEKYNNENENKNNISRENDKKIENKEKGKEENKEMENNKEIKENDNKKINEKEEKKEKEENNGKEDKIEEKNEKIVKEFDGLEKIINLINISNENSLFYIEILIKKLSYLRSKGMFKITERAYNLILSIFDTILRQNPKNDYILKNILILSQTFFKLENDEKIYLQNGMKGRKIFNSTETWHRVINYSMNLSCSDKDLSNLKTNEIIDKINKESHVIVIAYLCDIKQYTDNEKVFNDVKNYYVNIYHMDGKKVDEEVENYMKTYSKKNKEMEIKKEKEVEIKKEKEEKEEMKKEKEKDENEKKNDKKINYTLNDIITDKNVEIVSNNNNIDIKYNLKPYNISDNKKFYKNIEISKENRFEINNKNENNINNNIDIIINDNKNKEESIKYIIRGKENNFKEIEENINIVNKEEERIDNVEISNNLDNKEKKIVFNKDETNEINNLKKDDMNNITKEEKINEMNNRKSKKALEIFKDIFEELNIDNDKEIKTEKKKEE